MLKKLIIATVRFSAGHPWPVLLAAIVLSVASGYYVADNFALNTDITTLISPKLEWRQREVNYLKAFPGQATMILAVIDAPTPELAGDAAQKLTQKLNEQPNDIRGAQEMMGGPFFRRNGMLFLSEDNLKEALSQLTRSSSFLEPLAADPSLRGVMSAFALPLRGVQLRRVSLDSLAPQFNALAAPIETTLAGRPAYFSWRELLSGEPPSGRERRAFVEIDPLLDFNALEPGEDATNAIHAAADSLKLKEQGVTVRLTGSIPIADDEFATLKEGAELNGALTVFAVLIILWLALHSVRIILAVFVSLFVGLFVTAAAGTRHGRLVQSHLHRLLRAVRGYRRRFRAAIQRELPRRALRAGGSVRLAGGNRRKHGRAPGAGRRGNGRRLPRVHAHGLSGTFGAWRNRWAWHDRGLYHERHRAARDAPPAQSARRAASARLRLPVAGGQLP